MKIPEPSKKRGSSLRTSIAEFINTFTLSLGLGPKFPSIILRLRWPFISWRFPWLGKRRMLAALGPDLAGTVKWVASDGPGPLGEIVSTFYSTTNIDKALHYLPVYESALGAFRSRPIRMLEIGVDRGGSMQMWRKYLHDDSQIVGIDINPAAQKFDDPSLQLHVRIGDQKDPTFLEALVREFGLFDVILDDGSHMTSHMVQTFQYLFPNGLAPGGLYMVEDIGANYQRPWRDRASTFVDFTKRLIDAMHAHYQAADGSSLNFRVGDPHRTTQFTVPFATTIIEKVEFYDSIAVIHRAKDRREVPRGIYR